MNPTFANYTETGTRLLTDPGVYNTATFELNDTNMTIANTIRRCILTDTRSVGFRADLTDAENPGVKITKNTSVIFNEMLAHRLTLLPLGVVRIDEFDPTEFKCVLQIKNETKELLPVTASSFRLLRKTEEGTFEPMGAPETEAMFPRDPITNDSCLLITLRPQWNPEQPAEEIQLEAQPVIGRGRDHMGFCPASQCSFGNTPDTDPLRRQEFFNEWAIAYKQIADPASLNPEQKAPLEAEWNTMAAQRCFRVGRDGQPNSFTFTVESVGIRPVKDIVSEGIQAAINLVAPYADETKTMSDLGMSTQPVDSRMNGINVIFDDQEHTLGNLLQTIITEIYLDSGKADSPITFAGYKVRHPLHRVMTLTLGIREGVAEDAATLARQIVTEAAGRARDLFSRLKEDWDALQPGARRSSSGEMDG
jgi:DNA-directed RNA polymerase subunit L